MVLTILRYLINVIGMTIINRPKSTSLTFGGPLNHTNEYSGGSRAPTGEVSNSTWRGLQNWKRGLTNLISCQHTIFWGKKYPSNKLYWVRHCNTCIIIDQGEIRVAVINTKMFVCLFVGGLRPINGQYQSSQAVVRLRGDMRRHKENTRKNRKDQLWYKRNREIKKKGKRLDTLSGR